MSSFWRSFWSCIYGMKIDVREATWASLDWNEIK